MFLQKGIQADCIIHIYLQKSKKDDDAVYHTGAILKIRKLNQRPLNNSKVNLQPTS